MLHRRFIGRVLAQSRRQAAILVLCTALSLVSIVSLEGSLGQVTINYGQICLQTGRFDQGLDWVRAAYRRAPQAVYRLMEANFLMLQGRFEQTAQVLADLRRRPGLSATDRGHLQVLDQALARRRAEAGLSAAD